MITEKQWRTISFIESRLPFKYHGGNDSREASEFIGKNLKHAQSIRIGRQSTRRGKI